MKPNKKPKNQRIKFAAIPVLLGVLAYLLLAPTQPEQDSEAMSPATAQTSQQPAMQSVQPAPAATAVQSWPEVDLTFLLQDNPMSSQNADRGARSEHFTSASGNPAVTASNSSVGSTSVSEVATLHTAPDPVQQLVQNLTDSQVNYVFRSNRHKAVMLGDQMFEQGAQLSDSIHLHDILNDVLVLKESHHPRSLGGWISKLNAWASDVGVLMRIPTPPTPLDNAGATFN